jgi:hypothetical protein
MTPSTNIRPPNHGMAAWNFLGQIIKTKYQPPTKVKAPAAIRSQ